MRVCLLSKFGQSTNLLYSGTRFGLEENGIPYLDINISRERSESSPYWISIPSLIPHPPKLKDKMILQKIAAFKPDVLFLLQYAGIPFLIDNGDRIRLILGNKGKIAVWLVDLFVSVNENKILGNYIDFLFLSNRGQIDEYKSRWGLKNVYFMPQGCYLAKDYPVAKSYLYEVVFLGRRQRQDPRYNERNMLLDAFKQSIGLTEFDEGLEINHVIELYQKSKIIIGSSWRNDIELYSSDRIFNVLGAGGFYLCSYFPGIEKLFENGKHLVWFKTVQEGIEKAKYYLTHDAEREKIAYNGYLLAKEKHSYKERVKNIIDIILQKKFEFSGYLI